MKPFIRFRATVFGLLVVTGLYGQEGADSMASPPNRKVFGRVLALHGIATTGSLLALNQSWYADYPTRSFHVTNDWADWNQMDKLGHIWTAYSLARLSALSWREANLHGAKADWAGVVSAIGYQSFIEIADGFSAHWGFSWGDFAANLVGTSLYISQQRGWGRQRIQVKVMAYKPYLYGGKLAARADALFGAGPVNRLLNDYNIQTYWISANLGTFLPESRMPAWLNLSIGYGSRLMLGRNDNRWLSATGYLMDRSDVPRYRRIFLAPDIDLSALRTRSRFLRSLFLVLNTLKLPSPALEFSRGRVKGHWLLLN